MPYPWHDGDTLAADDLNAAIAEAGIGPQGPDGAPGVMIQTGYGPPTADATEGTTYFDLSNGDVWTFSNVVPPAPYAAPAVRFSAYLQNDALVATDNAFFSASYWQKADAVAVSSAWQIFSCNNSNAAPNASLMYPTDAATGRTEFYFADVGGDNYLDVRSSNYNKTVWHHFLVSFDAGHDAASMVGLIYIDDVLDAGAVRDAADVAFNHPVNGYGFLIGDPRFEFADVRIMPGVNLLDGSGAIPTATRRLFIDIAGKPVDPAVATAALGTPCVLFSGNAATFATNQGTGGAFSVVGSLTDATTSPSD